ncbi:barstar family protein [Clostridium lundense]|uniref:barstar family protein n=1 Tax=Clostridium lundense TaxID=319475 RepID=UPI000485F3D7|nr:barstar family protein [Clostridium lundense]
MEKVYIFEGKNVYDLNSFFSEFAKMVNAPNGYFGRDLQSFDDCLFGGFGLEAPCKIIWKDSNISKQRLNSEIIREYYEENRKFYEKELANEIDELCKHSVNPDDYDPFAESGIKYSIEMIEKAKRGEITMFDEIVSTIQSVTRRATFNKSWVIDLILE